MMGIFTSETYLCWPARSSDNYLKKRWITQWGQLDSFILKIIYLGFKVTFNTLYSSYHDGYFCFVSRGHTVGQGFVL